MNRLIKALCLTALVAAFLLLVNGEAAAAPADDTDKLEAFIDGVIYRQMDENNIVGATVAVVQDGEIKLTKGYGYADRENRVPVDPEETLFRIGSTGKLFTWTAVMQLVEQNLIDLDADVNEYLDLEIPDRLFGWDASGDPGPITMRHLLTHTPGFEDKGQGLFVLKPEEMLNLENYVKENIPARVYPPGEVMAYSNYGAALAGYIVERVSGLPFAEYVEENIYEPLGMEHSTFRQPLPDDLEPGMAEGYNFYNGAYYRGSFEYISALPAGSMSSAAEDMARFMIAHLQEGASGDARILEESTVREMHSRQFTQHPEQDGMTYGFIEQSINNRRIINHGGNTFLFATGFYLLPEENVGLFVSYNGGTGLEREALLTALMDRYYPAHETGELTPPEGSKERAAALTGEYLPNRANFTSMEKLFRLLSGARVGVNQDGYLLVNVLGYPQQFVEVEPGVYERRYTEGTDLARKIVFVEDSTGRMMMCGEGPVFTYTRAPWYGSGTTAGLLTVSTLLLMVTAIAGWIYASVGRVIRKEKSGAPKTALAARLVAAFYGLFLLIFIVALLSVVSDIDPAFGVPRTFLGEPAGLDTVLTLPYIIAAAAAIMLVFAVIGWINKYWTIGGRLHYTLLALSSLGMTWLMFYVNLL